MKSLFDCDNFDFSFIIEWYERNRDNNDFEQDIDLMHIECFESYQLFKQSAYFDLDQSYLQCIKDFLDLDVKPTLLSI